jgi:hypothetical protein
MGSCIGRRTPRAKLDGKNRTDEQVGRAAESSTRATAARTSDAER